MDCAKSPMVKFARIKPICIKPERNIRKQGFYVTIAITVSVTTAMKPAVLMIVPHVLIFTHTLESDKRCCIRIIKNLRNIIDRIKRQNQSIMESIILYHIKCEPH